MANDEKTLVKELRAAYDEKVLVGFWRKLHGSQFAAGLPDVLVAAGDVAALAEFKWIKSERTVFSTSAKIAVVDALTALQKTELTVLDAIDGPIRPRVIVGMPFDIPELPGGEGVVAVGADFGAWLKVDIALGDIASILLTARLTNRWDFHLPPGVEAQLRCRGEQWRAAPIVLGLKRYEIRTKYSEEAYADADV